jgi:hypothetical protein
MSKKYVVRVQGKGFLSNGDGSKTKSGAPTTRIKGRAQKFDSPESARVGMDRLSTGQAQGARIEQA